MTEEVDDPRELFARLDCDGLEDGELSFKVPEPIGVEPPEDNGDVAREPPELREYTVEFNVPKGERRAAALSELYNYSIRLEELPYPAERVYKTDTLAFYTDEEQVGYECVQGDKAGYVVVPPVEVVRVEQE